MTKETLTHIIEQLYEAHTQGLIQDYTTSFRQLQCIHQPYHAKIQKSPVPFSIFITFHDTTPQSKKIALKDYFISTHHAQAYLTLEETVLKVIIPLEVTSQIL